MLFRESDGAGGGGVRCGRAHALRLLVMVGGSGIDPADRIGCLKDCARADAAAARTSCAILNTRGGKFNTDISIFTFVQSLPIATRPTTLHWVRHGEVELDGVERVYGDMEMPLSRKGILQLEAVAEEFTKTKLTAVYASNLSRAVIGAGAIAKLQKLTVVEEPLLREIYRGAWRGLTWAEVEAKFPGGARRFVTEPCDYRDHRGETLADVERRAVEAWRKIVASNDGGDVAIVSHSWVVRTVMASVLGMGAAGALNVQADTASISTICSDGARWKIVHINVRVPMGDRRPRANDNVPAPTG